MKITDKLKQQATAATVGAGLLAVFHVVALPLAVVADVGVVGYLAYKANESEKNKKDKGPKQ